MHSPGVDTVTRKLLILRDPKVSIKSVLAPKSERPSQFPSQFSKAQTSLAEYVTTFNHNNIPALRCLIRTRVFSTNNNLQTSSAVVLAEVVLPHLLVDRPESIA